MEIEFCPELQIDWSLKSISFNAFQSINVTLVSMEQQEKPDPAHRHGKDVMSWPDFYVEKTKTEFIFNKCNYFNIRDDLSPGLSESDEGQGKTFLRLLRSELLTLNQNRAIEGLFHYRIITDNEIIDVLCFEAPVIIRK